MGRAFDLAGSYTTLLPVLAGVMMAVGFLLLLLPRYQTRASSVVATQPA